jgi:hypothetical protein
MSMTRPSSRVAAAGAAALGAYVALVRPWFRRWGATDEELEQRLPGDDIVERPRTHQTHAVTIDTSPVHVWPWLLQMGQGRGGLYSYDRLENWFGCRLHSAERVLPDLQHLAAGDTVRLVPQDYRVPLQFEVALVDPPRALVLKAPGTLVDAFTRGLSYCSWAFVLEELDGGRTRLIARWRSDFDPTVGGLIWNKWGIEPVHFLMERKMLLGIKARAERTAAPEEVPVEGTAA